MRFLGGAGLTARGGAPGRDEEAGRGRQRAWSLGAGLAVCPGRCNGVRAGGE